MYKNETIGIGIITYNREIAYLKLLNSIKDINFLDFIVIVKHQDIDYHENDPINFVNDKIKYFNIKNKLGVASVKNKAMQELLNLNCDHIFIIEDDMEVLNECIFKEYIDIAKKNGIEHLNFRRTNKPVLCEINDLVFYPNLVAAFQYFTGKSLKQVGLMDERYINLLEHVEHTYRFHLLGLTAPKFHVFPDIKNSVKYLKFEEENESTIIQDEKYKINLINGFKYFYEKYGIEIKNIQPPTYYELKTFYDLTKNKI
jgi:GT2 family glycosyltransferase